MKFKKILILFLFFGLISSVCAGPIDDKLWADYLKIHEDANHLQNKVDNVINSIDTPSVPPLKDNNIELNMNDNSSTGVTKVPFDFDWSKFYLIIIVIILIIIAYGFTFYNYRKDLKRLE
jgi:hypothetical protein